MGRFLKGLLILALLLQLGFIFAQPARADQGKTESQNEYWPSRLRFSAGGGGGDGARGIFYIDELLPLFYTKDKATLWFLNTKENWQTPNSQEYNMGTGIRHIFNDKFVVGLHYFFDKKLSKKDIWHNQNGVGLEFLSQPFDFRFNWYDPTVKGRNGSTVVSNYYRFGPMQLLQVGPREEALGGYDFEFGTPVFEKQTRTRVYLGGFFFDSKIAKDVNGFRVRTETNLNKWLAFDTTFNHWGSGKNEVIGSFRVTVPFELGRVKDKGNPFKVSEMDYIHDRLFERVVRDIDVKTNTSGIGDVQEPVPGVNMIYADNSNTTGTEDGTLAHPYSTISGAFGDPRFVGNGGNARYIYVFNGLGTSTGYSDGYTLPENGVLWGSGYNGGYNGLPTPGFPLLEGSGILLDGNNTTVMGLQLQNIDGDVIRGSIISNVNINHNIITGNNGRGIYLENYRASSNWNITGNTISDNSDSGVYLYNGDPADAYQLSNVNISGNEITGNTHGVYIDNHYPMSNVTISGNIISNNGTADTGIHVYNESDISNFSISGNTINGNGGPGIYLDNDGGDMNNIKISGNTINDNTGPGISLDNYGYASLFDISGNSISGNHSFRSGIDIYNYSTAENFKISGNNISGNYGDGIYIENNAGGGKVVGPLQITDGLEFYGMRNFEITGNIISGNFGSGIHLENYGGGGPFVPFVDGGDGISPTPDMSNFTITGNTITGNRSVASGIHIYNEGYASGFTVSDNTISGNSGAGIDIYNDTGELSDITISNNTISNNLGSGIGIQNYDEMDNVTISGNTISGNSSEPTCGIDVYSNEGYTHDFSFTNNTIKDNIGAGIDIYSEFSDVENFTFTLNKITGNIGSGIAIGNFQSGMYGFSFTGNTIKGNGMPIDGIEVPALLLDGPPRGAGISISNFDAGLEDFTFTGNTISDNYGDGFSLYNEYGYANNFSFSLNNISNNAGNGLSFGMGDSDTYNIDLGGGTTGALGFNTIQNNQSGFDLINGTSDTITAKNNSWTQPFDPARISGDVIY